MFAILKNFLSKFKKPSLDSYLGAVNFTWQSHTQNPPKGLETLPRVFQYPIPDAIPDSVLIIRNQYALCYDLESKIAKWVAYTLTPEMLHNSVPRETYFMSDQSLAIEKRATVEDYGGNRFDMGHMMPCEDGSDTIDNQHETFILSNIIPQSPNLNRQIWKYLEDHVRKLVKTSGISYCVLCGPSYNLNDQTIGKNKITVPHGFWKAIVNNSTKEVTCWYFPHLEPYSSTKNIDDYLVDKSKLPIELKFNN